ncbi:hypothetical protein QAD02_013646 [Eretmocerus hayati]|uniref:Uncharacterized protein n=1 Tax=Eretmocerus hayati TaxID=131215 RepID=A0ACC2P2R6_9HYME|nr:hypothetical protein QAD02_013646 [Eretmocerus hayati]
MDSCPGSRNFFDLLENLYVYFIPTERHKLIVHKLTELKPIDVDRILLPKRVDTTRWSSRGKAVKSVHGGYEGYKAALSILSACNDEARGLLELLDKLETSVYLLLRNDILDRVDATSSMLQSYNAKLTTSITLLKSLSCFIESLRNKFEYYESQAKQLSGHTGYHFMEKRECKVNVRLGPLDQNQAPDACLTGSQKFRVGSYLPVIDQLVSSPNARVAAYEGAHSVFGFLRELNDFSPEEIRERAGRVVKIYEEDLEDNLANELIQFRSFTTDFMSDERDDGKKLCFGARALKMIIEKGLEGVFPNTSILLKTYLVLMTTNCTTERSFSKIIRTRDYTRTSMGQTRLSNLTRMSTESDLLRNLSFEDVIDIKVPPYIYMVLLLDIIVD